MQCRSSARQGGWGHAAYGMASTTQPLTNKSVQSNRQATRADKCPSCYSKHIVPGMIFGHFQVKAPTESKGPWDIYKLVATIPADQAFRPLNDGGCTLVKQ